MSAPTAVPTVSLGTVGKVLTVVKGERSGVRGGRQGAKEAPGGTPRVRSIAHLKRWFPSPRGQKGSLSKV